MMIMIVKVIEIERMVKIVIIIEGDIMVLLINIDSNSIFYRDSDRDRVSDSGSGYKVVLILDSDR